jgi:gamma-glutamyltranspeptidase
MGRHGVITAGHYLATAAGMRMFERGGNAVDAGVAAGLALSVLKPQDNGIGGEVPILVYDPRARRVVAISGMGTAPARATIAWFRAAGIALIPGNGLLPACVPAAFDAWVTALAAFGTLSLRDVLTPALELAAGGFAMYQALREAIVRHEATFRAQWPTTAAIYLPGGRVPDIARGSDKPAPGDRITAMAVSGLVGVGIGQNDERAEQRSAEPRRQDDGMDVARRSGETLLATSDQQQTSLTVCAASRRLADA